MYESMGVQKIITIVLQVGRGLSWGVIKDLWNNSKELEMIRSMQENSLVVTWQMDQKGAVTYWNISNERVVYDICNIHKPIN